MTSSSLLHARLALALLVGTSVGCGGGGKENSATAIRTHGPHGGHTAEMSENADFEMEFTLDEKRRRIVIYVQESGGLRPYPLAIDSLSGRFEADGQSVDVTFAADARPSDPKGRASRFTLALDSLPQQLLAADRFVLKLTYTVAGKSIAASFPHRNDHGHEYRHD